MRALLDVNVLIALLDDAHVHHGVARAWLAGQIQQGWASCPLTQLGCVRIMSNPGYANAQPAALVAQRLAKATRTAHHEFWPADANPLGAEGGIDWTRVLSARHVTDVYLLSLAVARDGRFVTLDAHVPLHCVPQAKTRHCVVIG
jgi:toxin-antitoxin system PIN domain toxin